MVVPTRVLLGFHAQDDGTYVPRHSNSRAALAFLRGTAV